MDGKSDFYHSASQAVKKHSLSLERLVQYWEFRESEPRLKGGAGFLDLLGYKELRRANIA